MAAGANTPLDGTRAKKSGVVRIGLLGGFSVAVGDRKVDQSAWRLRKAASLVKLLALAPGHRLHRERAMDLLWPESGKKAASNNLRQTLHVARKILHPDPGIASGLLGVSGEQLLCARREGFGWTLRPSRKRLHTARRSKDPAAYRAALELYSGELLPEDRYEEWAESRRGSSGRGSFLFWSSSPGSTRSVGRRRSGAAVQALQRVLAEEPTNEEAHVGLMRLYASSGRSGEALRQYVSSRKRSPAVWARSRAPPRAPLGRRSRPEGFRAAPYPGRRTEPRRRLRRSAAHNLPARRTSFVGREREMLEVKRALAMTRLLTLTGPGGSGKTRLALEVARDLVGAYPDGVWLVELAPLSEGELVPQAVAKALKCRSSPDNHSPKPSSMPCARRSCSWCSTTASTLSRQRPSFRTSSFPLARTCGLWPPAARRWGLRESSCGGGSPFRSKPTQTLIERPAAGELVRYEAVRLFVERARLRSPHFELTEENAGAVAQICRRLEGMPLAVELAAARVRALSLEQIAQRLEDSLKLLSGIAGPPVAPSDAACDLGLEL